jgi:septal ring factor EnvC (AmiA/AmiB activator)
VGIYSTLRPAHELHVSGGHGDQHLRLVEYDHQVSAKNCLIKDIQMGNQDLLQENHHLEAHVKELNDELMRTYRSRNVKSDFLNDAHTWLKNAQDELVAA